MLIITALVVTATLLHHALALQPGFISPLQNHTVAAGRSAHFTCVVNNLGGHKVAWLRSDSKAILAIQKHMVTNNPRMSVEHNGHNSWTLRIRRVMRNDSGIYMCQINTEPMKSQVGVLQVFEAPDILYNETSNDTVVPEGAGVTLKCEARGFPEPRVTWRREDGRMISVRGDNRVASALVNNDNKDTKDLVDPKESVEDVRLNIGAVLASTPSFPTRRVTLQNLVFPFGDFT